MKTLYLTIAALSLTAVTSVHAQMAQPVATEQNYDVKNTTNLQSNAGFIGLEVGRNPISSDNTTAGVVAQNQITAAQLNAMQPAAGDVNTNTNMNTNMAADAAVPTTTNAQTRTTIMAPQPPAQVAAPTVASPSMPAAPAVSQANNNPQMPAQNNASVSGTSPMPTAPVTSQGQANFELNAKAPAAAISTKEIVEVDTIQPAGGEGQTVVKTHKIIGNTDTGVNPDKILQAIENQEKIN